MSIFKIAVTGSAGSGKSTACKYFEDLGLKILDCDKIARDVVEPSMSAYKSIVDLFGKDILLNEGSLNRLKLRKIISSDTSMRQGMEDIMHPAILDSLFSKIKSFEAEGENAVVVEIPLLFELNLSKKFDFVVTIAGEEEDLVDRIKKRDNVSKEDAREMLSIQFPQQEKVKSSDFVIWNTSGAESLKSSVAKLYQKIKKEYLT